MVAAITSQHQQHQQSRRAPLLQSSQQDNPRNGISPRKPKARHVSSRYMSPSPSSSSSSSSTTTATSTTPAPARRFPSPLISRSTNSPIPSKRSVSADRRRPPPPSDTSAAAKLLVSSSTRSLSVSFQGEAFSLPITKPTPPTRTTPLRPERDHHHTENSRPWPARSRNSLTRSVDFGSAPLELSRRVSFDASADVSDTDSASSGGSSVGALTRLRASAPRGLVVSAKFWQETNSRMRRLQDPGSPLSPSPVSSRIGVNTTPGKFPQAVSSSPRTMGSPIRGMPRPASPSKLSTPSRGAVSPARGRSPGSAPSILSFSMDVRRGKMGEDRIVDAHMLRLLYNRYLEWRFVNARADSTFMVHKLNAEKNLWNAWVTISELRHSVTLKRIKLLLLKQKLKLTSIIKEQITNLEDWALLDRDHSNSLLGATEALKASTLRLPVVGKTVADIQKLKDAVSSAVDVMQEMGTSICSVTVKVDDMNSVVAELVKVTGKERILLQQCKDFLSTLSAMQVKDCSLRTHIVQFNRVPTASSLTTRV